MQIDLNEIILRFFRDDIAIRRCDRSSILNDAPVTDGEFFIVPRIVEGK